MLQFIGWHAIIGAHEQIHQLKCNVSNGCSSAMCVLDVTNIVYWESAGTKVETGVMQKSCNVRCGCVDVHYDDVENYDDDVNA